MKPPTTDRFALERPSWLLGALLFALAALLYLPASRGEFVYDDLLLVDGNPALTPGKVLEAAFTRSYWAGYDAESAGEVGYWRPLSALALALGRALGGGAPGGFHLVSILVHAFAAWAAFCLAWRLSAGSAFAPRQRLIVAGAASLLFAWHPLHVESVAWISSIGDPLATMFVLVAAEHWLAWRSHARRATLAGFAAAAAAAFLAKESGLALVAVIVAIELFSKRDREDSRDGGPARTAWWVLGGLLTAYWLARFAVFADWRAGLAHTVTDFGVSTQRLLLLRAELFAGFLQLLAWPAELTLFRPFRPQLAGVDLGWIAALCAGYLLIALLLARRGPRPAGLAWSLILAWLLPVLVSVASLGIFPLSDRYAYGAVFGFTLCASILLTRLLPWRLAPIVLGVVAGLYAWRSLVRMDDWASEERLFARAVAESPRTAYARWGYGRVLLTRYKETRDPADLEAAKRQYDEAMDLLERAAVDSGLFATKRDHLEANLGLGWTVLFEDEASAFGPDGTALKIFERAASYAPDSARAHVGAGVALFQLGRAEEAGTRLRRAIELNPESHEAHAAMGRVLFHLGDGSGAVREYERALELRPGHFAYRLQLAQALGDSGELGRMTEILLETQRRFPARVEPLRMLGAAAVQQGNPSEALRWLDLAIEADPRDAVAHQWRGQVLAVLERPQEALAALLEACNLDTQNFEAHFNAAAMLAASSEPERAIGYFARAWVLRPVQRGKEERDAMGEAIEAKLLELAPRDAALWCTLGEHELLRGELGRERAMRLAERSLEIDPQFALAQLLLGQCLLRAEGREDEALGALDRAAEFGPAEFETRYQYGIALMDRGRQREALVELRAAAEHIGTSRLTDEQRADVARTLAARITALAAAVGEGE